MRHLLEFNQFEGQENEIRECFIELLEDYEDVDFTIKPTIYKTPWVKPSMRSKLPSPKIPALIVNISFSKHCEWQASTKSEHGISYRPVKNGQELADIVAAGIDKLRTYHEMEIVWAKVDWVNAGEWKLKNPGKFGDGPGILEKAFRANDLKGDELPDFISKLGDRLRYIKIYVAKR